MFKDYVKLKIRWENVAICDNIYTFILQVIRELDSGHQLENVNKLKIVEYQYKPEYLHQQQLFGFDDDHGKILQNTKH